MHACLKTGYVYVIRYLAPLGSCAYMLKDWLVICDEYCFLVAGQLGLYLVLQVMF